MLKSNFVIYLGKRRKYYFKVKQVQNESVFYVKTRFFILLT